MVSKTAAVPGGPAGRPLPTDPDALLYPVEAAHLLAMSERTLEGLRLRGGGPTFYRLRRSIRYRRCDINAWIEARHYSSTASVDAGRQ
ncbi:MAG: helix-turn-helix domain-containing protein [Alphaproteobacteria bacterium]|nr:helix-turn-helix domain-containing protein [Alphaproteobacteria bacterium]